MISPVPPPTAADPDWDFLAGLPGVADALADARAMVDRVLVHRVLRTRTPALAAESALRGARASAALAGVDLPEQGPDGGLPESPVLAGALRAYAELARLRAVWTTSPRQALARLHLLAAADLVGPDLLGRPVDAAGAAAVGRIAGLAGAKATVPALLVAAVVEGELGCAAAFAEANGVLARAAARLVLATRGLDPPMLCVPEVGHLELGDHDANLASYGEGDRGPWLANCARAALLGAREALAMAEALARG